jgi:hypothetical protein
MPAALGDKLIAAARSAQRDVTLIAPFVKADILEAVLKDIGAAVPVRLVARWIPAEIAAGVCDLEIFDVMSARPNAELYTHPLLHAKLYRFDDTAFFGSANLTGKALGWTAPTNVELLHAPREMLDDLVSFEAELLRSAVRVDAAYRDIVRGQVEKIKDGVIAASDVFDADTHGVERTWLPICMTPGRLWNVYADAEATRRRMVESAFEAAETDLAALRIPSGLPVIQFNQHIAATLGQMPLVQEIDAASCLAEGVTAATAAALIEAAAQGLALPYPAIDMWEVLQSWLLHFFPQRYRREVATEVFRQGRVIG